MLHVNFAFIFLIVIQLISQTQSAGILELRLLSFKNDLSRDLHGSCCGYSNQSSDNKQCNELCNPYFRICLKQWENPVNPDPPCYFGSRITQTFIHGNSNGLSVGRGHMNFTHHRDYTDAMKFPFSFNWPGTMSIIVEAWHVSRNARMVNISETANAYEKQLLIRVAEPRELKVNHEWTLESHSTNYSGLEFEYRVVCDEFYYGYDCGRYCRPRDDQYGHHLCTSDGHKQCMKGWTGSLCNRAICSPGCHPENGYCSIPGECQCYLGYQGALCDHCVKYPGCVHGSCRRSFECQCDEGWGGLFCNQDLNFCTHHKPCHNGATCINTGSGHYTCQCQPEFTGFNCEHRLETCTDQSCLNGGTCIEKGFNYTCVCPVGYSGRHCQSNARTCDDQPCENGGSCINTVDGGYMCMCSQWFDGTNCDVEKDECASENPCQNGGTCINIQRFPLSSTSTRPSYECTCSTGFTGRNCEININDCSIHPCLNNGSCVDLIGSFQCHCPPGFMGAICQYNIDDCLKRPCANGGTCFDLVNDFECVCRPGFRGKDCSIDINECESNPCRNGGTCIDYIDAYHCVCPRCFNGLNCQVRNDDCASKYNLDYGLIILQNGNSSSSLISTQRKDISNYLLLIGLPISMVFIMVLTLFLVFIYLRNKRALANSGSNEMNNIIHNQLDHHAHTKSYTVLASSSEKFVHRPEAERNYYKVVSIEKVDPEKAHIHCSAKPARNTHNSLSLYSKRDPDKDLNQDHRTSDSDSTFKNLKTLKAEQENDLKSNLKICNTRETERHNQTIRTSYGHQYHSHSHHPRPVRTLIPAESGQLEISRIICRKQPTTITDV